MRLNSKWTLWHHSLENKKWDIDSYIKLYEITSVEDFWQVFNNVNIQVGMFFLMKGDIKPLWETSENINGGAWSYMYNNASKEQINDLFYNISSGVLGGGILEQCKTNNITGISMSPKMNGHIFKIWYNNCEVNNVNFSSDFINESIKFMFKPHKRINR